jgi:hypothetical protein
VLRSAAAALTAAGLAGCDLGRQSAEPPPGPDPLAPFLAQTRKLAQQYDTAITTVPSLSARLTPLRDDHRAHVAALERETGSFGTPSGSAEPSATEPPRPAGPADATPAGVLAALAAAEKAAQAQAEQACLSAPTYRAALLGSIAACRASHRTALA